MNSWHDEKDSPRYVIGRGEVCSEGLESGNLMDHEGINLGYGGTGVSGVL